MRHLITGGAGCIGSELAGALLARGEHVRVLDNLSSGRQEHIAPFMDCERFEFMREDVGDKMAVQAGVQGCDTVWHLAAKTDIKFVGKYDFEADYTDNLRATWVLLRAMHERGVNRLAFASSAAVYGEGSIDKDCDCADCMAGMPVLCEDQLPAPVSMYGATKLSCEAIIRAMALRAGIQSWIFRYCSIVSGKARTSGNMVVPDLMHKLQKDPTRLEILGDGNQTKPSLHVRECVDAMQFVVANCKDQVSIHNIGAPDAISVTRQAELVCEAMGVNPAFIYTGGAGGWPGDVPSFRMCVEKLAALGWRAKRTSEEAVKLAIQGLLESGE